MTMKVLVTVASKHGSTMEIAASLADTLRETGLDVTLKPVEEVASMEGVDAVVLGSAVYAGRWLGAATRLVEGHRQELLARPVWLFSSGPIGAPPKPDGDPADAAIMVERTAARGHRLFAGRIDRSDLGFAERAVVRVVGAAEGDYRPWDEISAYAREIATELRAVERTTAPA
jgi:menaquinone-dependent protoporphyrinogen oxidase